MNTTDRSDHSGASPELAVGAGFGSAAPADIADSPEYQAWVESMAHHCRCSHDRPCAGVLAGGLCDDLHDDEIEPDICTHCRGSGQYDDATPCLYCDGDGTDSF